MDNQGGNLPFWGKQKPLRHYFEGAVLKFNVRLNELFCTLIVINKKGRFVIDTFKVKDKEHLEGLLKITRIEDI